MNLPTANRELHCSEPSELPYMQSSGVQSRHRQQTHASNIPGCSNKGSLALKQKESRLGKGGYADRFPCSVVCPRAGEKEV